MWFGKSKRLAAELATAREKIQALNQDKEKLKEQLKAAKGKVQHLRDAGVPLDLLEYNSDGLSVWGKNLAFMHEERFRRAYELGCKSGHKFAADSAQFHVEWRVHVALWAAQLGMKLQGDFVECGVNTGILSLAIADYVDFAASGRQFYLFDTFCGIPEEQMDAAEREKSVKQNELYYAQDCFEQAKANFAPYPNMHLVKGKVPDTLTQVNFGRVAYLSIDMNVTSAELAAMEFFWDKLVTGAPIVLDDYGWAGHESQKTALDDFARRVNSPIVTLPTGQGLMFKL